MRTRTHARAEDGQTMVLSIVFLVVLIGFCALLIDGGSWLWTKRSLQGDADAAALAAVREMPDDPGNARAVAEDYAEVRNSHDEAELESFISDTSNMTATVVLSRTAASSPFGQLLGVSDAAIRARARARIAQVGSVDTVLPFAALDGTIEVHNPPRMEQMTVSPGGIQTGHIGTIAPAYPPPACNGGTTNSAQELEAAIRSIHASGGVTTCGTMVGNTVNTSTGARPNRLRDGINARLGSTNGTHPDLFDDVFSWDADIERYVLEKPTSPRIGFIPIVSTGASSVSSWGDIPGTSASVRIVDYVMVYIGRVGEPGEPAYVEQGNQLEVFMTPIFGMITPNFDYELRDTWTPGSMAPTAITLEE